MELLGRLRGRWRGREGKKSWVRHSIERGRGRNSIERGKSQLTKETCTGDERLLICKLGYKLCPCGNKVFPFLWCQMGDDEM